MFTNIATLLDGGTNFLTLILVGSIGLSLLSFMAACWGHWCAVLLAIPPVVAGSILTWEIVAESFPKKVTVALWFWFPTPVIFGLASVVLWAIFRHRTALETRKRL